MKFFRVLFSAVVCAAFVLTSCNSDEAGKDGAPSDVTRILAIGNSFSEDALDTYFHDICEAAGKKVIIGDLYIPGCPVDRHLLNARTDSAAYRFRRIGLDGATIETLNVPLADAIGSDDWDFISFQQASGVSGKFDSYSNIAELLAYVDSLAPEKARLAWHQTWAYSADSTHPEYDNYDRNQQTMYDSIMAASHRVIEENPELTVVIPSGTAIQEARAATGDYDMTRDGYHLDLVLGRYIAGCAWYEAIFGESVVGNGFVPEGMTPEQARIAQEAAHAASAAPFGK